MNPVFRGEDHIVLEIDGIGRVGDLDASARSALFDAIAQAEGDLGGACQVHFMPSERALRVIVARETSDLPRITFGGRGGYLIDPIERSCRSASAIDMVAAFVMQSGVRAVEYIFLDALERGVNVRVLTGDYLGRTQPDALHHLLDIARSVEGGEPKRGSLEVRVVETESLGRDIPSFHPKAWILDGERGGRAWVGSSNLSRAALTSGIEWNLRLDRREDPEGFDAIHREWSALWEMASVIDRRWVEAYRARAEARANEHPQPDPPSPRHFQREALAALDRHRDAGHDEALVVLATGLGKTYLAAFDVAVFEGRIGRAARVLFLAHRAELLRQASRTFRHVFPARSVGFVTATSEDLDADMVFASIFSMANPERLLALRDIDYVIVDEAHHARAATYQRVLRELDGAFSLGLTATPERGDGQDILPLFGGSIVYEANLGQGIREGSLVPLRYFGLADTVDYAPIPWRSGRFSDEDLARALATEARMQRVWEAWCAHPGARTLVFCCTIGHADYVARWLSNKGIRAAAVHSGPESASRASAVEMLSHGALDALCTVDLFNEGVDIPSLDRVVMLRPTGSRVIFLQQLGRGLRTAPGKEFVSVLDFVGNHAVFSDRLATLVGWLRDTPLRQAELLTPDELAATLPDGCFIDIELAAIDILAKLLPDPTENALLGAYRQIREETHARPLAVTLQTRGVNVWVARRSWGGWFQLVHEEGDLDDAEQRVLARSKQWFDSLEGLTTSAAALESLRALVRAIPKQGAAIVASGTLDAPMLDELTASNIALQATDRDISFEAVIHDDRETWASMTLELLDYLIIRRRDIDPGALQHDASFEVRVIRNATNPILTFDRSRAPGIPEGETPVSVEGEGVWMFRFVKMAVNVAYPVGESSNRLGELLERWFGDQAGARGTAYRVRFEHNEAGWRVAPRDGRADSFVAGELLGVEEIARRLGVGELSTSAGEAALDGVWSLAFVSATNALARYDLLRGELATARAHVFFPEEGGERWRYHGVGERDEEQAAWRIEDVDAKTYAMHCEKSSKSRDLPQYYRALAAAFSSKLLESLGEERVVKAYGKSCRVVDVKSNGSVRIEGIGEDGFGARNVSVTDLGWVLCARQELLAEGITHLDEARVHRMRYLPGTKTGSMRYIDTGWALVLTHGWAP